MTAADARTLLAKQAEVDTELVSSVLKSWHRAIEAACRRGKAYVRDRDVERLRTPVPESVHEAVRQRLRVDGFIVRIVTEEYNTTAIEVSWPAA